MYTAKHTIEEILSNEKYTGDVKALKKFESGTYLIEHLRQQRSFLKNALRVKSSTSR